MEIGSGSWTESGGSSSSSPPNSSESLIGLKFGQKIYFEDVGLGPPPKSGGGSSSNATAQPRKAKGGAVQGAQPPRCQVEGCNVDLSDVKAYYSRHKVCSMHSKSSKVVVAGLEQRFCQQCSRFHQLPEFDQGKRSCRRRLAGHNERRRKPPPGALLSSRYNRLASSVYENGGRVGSFVMDFSAYPRRDAPRLAPANQITATGKYLPQHPWHSNTENDLFLQASSIPPGSGECFSESSCALSLLSNQPWNRTSGLALVSSDQAPAAPPHTGVVANPFPNASWGFRGNEAGSGASLGMASHSGNLLSGELEQDRRNYMELEHPRPYDSAHPMHHWSL